MSIIPLSPSDKCILDRAKVPKETGTYGVIYVDPPWSYSDKNCNGAALKQYQTMTIQDLAGMCIGRLAAKDCALFMWATYPLLKEALWLIDAWGFKYKSIAFQWVKTYTPKEDGTAKPTFGLGRWTRGNTEPCLLATRGKPFRANNSVSQLVLTQEELVVSKIGRHSEKPQEVRDRIVKLMGDVPRIELFARQQSPGWAAWGNELPEHEELDR